ncbi:MAG: GtrA family protein [Chloroflexi bacterium]|nr:GtrA family protein [Chloroflexota bacterium]
MRTLLLSSITGSLTRIGWGRVIRFGIVGLSGTVVNLIVIHFLFGQLHWSPTIAAAIAVEVSVVNNFIWNNRWTFGHRTISLVRFFRFNLASLGGLVITTIIFTVLVQWFRLHYIVADIVAIGAATSWNFVASIFWTWAA